MAGLVHARPSGGSTVAERLIVLSFAGARRTLYVANAYFVPNDFILRLLAQAVARGVDVRLLLPGEKTDIPATRQAGRAQYEALLAAGVRIWEYEPTMMHAKTFVVDGVWSAIGTLNLDNRSLAHNDESIFVAHDAGLGARMDSLFVADLEHATEIRLETFRQRSWRHRLREWAASLVGRLL